MMSFVPQMLLAAVLGAGLQITPPDPSRVPALIDAAESAMSDGDWSTAAGRWEEALTAAPNRGDLAYNLGVARYRSGAFSAAADAFRSAASSGDADLAAAAMYNEGTARYAEALERSSTEPPSPRPEATPDLEDVRDPVQEAMESVNRSLQHFKDAINADPTNTDARANAELAHRLLRQLEAIQQQQDQQQQDQQQQNQQQQDQQQQDQQQQDQQQQDQQQQEGEESNAPSQDSSQEKPDASTPPQPSKDDDRMTREEAERLLQSVRDKEKQRRREAAARRADDPRTPVERDW